MHCASTGVGLPLLSKLASAPLSCRGGIDNTLVGQPAAAPSFHLLPIGLWHSLGAHLHTPTLGPLSILAFVRILPSQWLKSRCCIRSRHPFTKTRSTARAARTGSPWLPTSPHVRIPTRSSRKTPSTTPRCDPPPNPCRFRHGVRRSERPTPAPPRLRSSTRSTEHTARSRQRQELHDAIPSRTASAHTLSSAHHGQVQEASRQRARGERGANGCETHQHRQTVSGSDQQASTACC